MVPRGSAEWAPSCSPRLLCGVTLLVVLITRVPARSITPGLQLEARSTNTRAQEECVPVHWDSYQHSSWDPHLNDQIPEYTMWQQFCIKNSTANFTVTFNPPKWSRQPYPLSYSEGRYHYNKTLHPYVTEDGRVCVNASITMYDLKGEIDYGDYTIIVSTDCSSSNMTFQLEIDKCGIKDIPRPIHPTLEPLIVPEGNGQRALTWEYMFFGDNQLTDYVFRITKSGETVCDESSPGSHFNCTRETLGQCHITITAHIQNYTHKDSGEYCAAAYPAGAPNPGNDSCLKLVVVQQPVVDPFPGKSQLGLGGASLVYHVSNFSEYVNITFVKDERKIIDPSGDGYTLKLQYDPLDNTTVTLTLDMTGNPQHAGDYTLCTSLVNDTSTRNCTTSISVSNGLWIGGVVGIVCAFLVVVCCCCLICFRKKCNPVTWFNKLTSKSKLNERTPELKQPDAGDDDDDLEKDSVGTKVLPADVRKLLDELNDIAPQWELFAEQIGVSRQKVEQIRAETGRQVIVCLNEALNWWITNYKKHTYEKIINVLEGRTVQNRELANRIRKFMRKKRKNPGTSARTSPECGRDDGTPNVALFCTIINFLRVCISCCRHEQQRSTNGYARLKEESNPTEGESDSAEDTVPGSRPGSSASGAAAVSESTQHQAVAEVHDGATETTLLLASTTAPGGYHSTQNDPDSISPDDPPRSRSQCESVQQHSKSIRDTGTVPEDDEQDSPWPHQLKTNTRTCTEDPVWQQIPDASLDLRLNEYQLQKTSELFTDWKRQARYLGLEEHTIAEIDEDNRASKERKYQMLYTWSQRQGDDATLKALLQCVEFKLGDRELAQRIFNTLN